MANSEPRYVAGSSIDPKFNAFTITNVPYKYVRGVPIEASILIPNDLEPGKHPVTVRWHGGGFSTGTRLFAEWYADWTLALTTKHAAIAIAPDYRLLPEARGSDILADCADFFRWLHRPGSLAAHLPAHLAADLARVLVTGESAGGWLALQSGFVTAAAAAPPVTAIIAHYPVIDVRAPFYTRDDASKRVGSPPWPRIGADVLRAHLGQLTGREVVTARTPPEGLPVAALFVQRGLYAEFFGTEPALSPLEMLRKQERFPPLWILHGTMDSIVPIEGTEKFVRAFRKRFEDGELHVSIAEGEEHSFDLHAATLDTDWVKSGVAFIEKHWLGPEA